LNRVPESRIHREGSFIAATYEYDQEKIDELPI